MRRVFSLAICFSFLVGTVTTAMCETEKKEPQDLPYLPPIQTPEQKAQESAENQLYSDYRASKTETSLYGASDGSRGSVRNLSGLYLRKTDRLVEILLSDALGHYYKLRSNAESAVQISQSVDELTADLLPFQVAQNHRIIQQNDEIISLLKQIASKK